MGDVDRPVHDDPTDRLLAPGFGSRPGVGDEPGGPRGQKPRCVDPAQGRGLAWEIGNNKFKSQKSTADQKFGGGELLKFISQRMAGKIDQ